MKTSFRRLFLGLALIASTAGLLLLSDLDSRVQSEPKPASAVKRVAFLQHASQTVLDEGRKGMIAGLAEQGWHIGQNLDFEIFNAEGDMPTAQNIAKAMTGGNYDLLMTNSTPSLQAVANSNRQTRKPHVFGLVTDPYGAGVGINPDDHLDHPPYLAGYGTMQPVAESLRLVMQFNPQLTKVGVVYNASESNSIKQIELARITCAELGLTLIEASVDNTSGVGEAAAAVIARGAETIWIPGDVTVIVGIDGVISAARKGNVPVFTVIPPNVKRGALFDVGANYFQVGHQTGMLAGEILSGRDPASVSIDNYMPKILMINEQTLAGLNDDWLIPPELAAQAQLLIDTDGVEHTKEPATPTQSTVIPGPTPGRHYRLAFAYYAPEPSWENCEQGLIDGLAELGFEVGRNLTITRSHAQGEMINIRQMLVNLDYTDADAIVTFTTPVLQGAVSAIREKPVVFTYVTDPLAAGAGTTFEDHVPHITGVGSLPPLADILRLTQLVLPDLKRLGTVYNSGEANSVKIVSILRDLCAQQGIELIEVTATTTSEVVQAAQALVTRGVDAFYMAADNTAYQAFDAVSKIAGDANLPFFGDDPGYIDRGFLFTVGPGYYFSGKAAAAPLARVLSGVSPADIPMTNVSVNVGKFSRESATRLGLDVPEAVIAKIEASGTLPPTSTAQASPPINPNPSGKTWNIQLFYYMESPPFEQAIEGITKVLESSPLVEGEDYTLRLRSAQGDMSALNGLLDAMLTARADMIIPLSTPALQVTVARVKNVPIVFGVVADPVAAGAANSYTDHPENLTGITVLGPATEMLDLLEKHFPDYRRLGTVFCPSETNSVYFKETFEKLCAERGFVLEAVPANSSNELPDAALALVSRKIDAIVQIPDNQSSAGFSAITRAARQAQMPLLSLNTTSVSLGAALAMGRDYGHSGEATGDYIVRVIGGESPGDIPIKLSPRTFIAASVPNANAVGMKLPQILLDQAEVLER